MVYEYLCHIYHITAKLYIPFVRASPLRSSGINCSPALVRCFSIFRYVSVGSVFAVLVSMFRYVIYVVGCSIIRP